MLVSDFLIQSAKLYPEKIALVCGNRRISYQEIDCASNSLAHALLSRGVERGDRVAIFLDNSAEAVISVFGILKAGCVFILLNASMKSAKLHFILDNSEAKILITDTKRSEVAEEAATNIASLKSIMLTDGQVEGGFSMSNIVSGEPDSLPPSQCIDIDLAALIYTSGTTGVPKGVMLTHLNIVSAASSITQYLENDSSDVIINFLPLSFDYGLYQMLMAFKVGARIVLEKSFVYPYVAIAKMQSEKVTGLPGVPTIFAILLQLKDLKKYDLSSLKYITNTGAALPVSHIIKLRETFPQAKIYSMYGLTECKRVSYLPPEELDRRPTSVGKAMPNTEVYIIDERGGRVGPAETGELVVRGANVMKGYWKMPEETKEMLRPGLYPGESVLYTGDLFKLDEEGFLYFVARKDDIIKSRGEKVSPKEIENVLYSLPQVKEAAVIGVPDEILGQAVKAILVPKDSSNLTKKEVIAHCARNLEDFMIPRIVEFRTSLPKTPTGKIKKHELV